MRFLLSSSSFRASLVSVRNLSSFRILRIFLRPLRSSPSCSSSSSSPLCGNYTSSSALWSSTLREGKKNFLWLILPPIIFRKGFRVEFKQHSVCHAWPRSALFGLDSAAQGRENFLECSRLLPRGEHFKHLLVAGRGFLNFNSASFLLLFVTSLLFLVLFGRSSTDRQTDLVKASRWLIQRQLHRLGGGGVSHLVFRCFPVFSDSLASSLIPDSALELGFSYSESSESSLPSANKLAWSGHYSDDLDHHSTKNSGCNTLTKQIHLSVLTCSSPFSSLSRLISPLQIRPRSSRVYDGAVCGVCRVSSLRHQSLKIPIDRLLK